MIRALSLGGVLALASGIAWADTIVFGSESLVNVPTSISNPSLSGTGCGVTGNPSGNCGYLGTGPYWDNESGKGSQMNIGYFLTGTGGYAGDTDYDPGSIQYLASGADSFSAPSDITLDHTSTSASVTLLSDATGDMTDVFGYYTDIGGTITLDQIYGSGSGPGSLAADIGDSLVLSSLFNNEDYGFYITKDCYSLCPAGDTSGTVTWYSNDSLDTTDVGNQHFVIFDSTTPGVYYIGIEDWGLMGEGGINGEANGDFNDIVFELNTDVPEPATFGLIGAGLLGLGLARFRTRKLRA